MAGVDHPFLSVRTSLDTVRNGLQAADDALSILDASEADRVRIMERMDADVECPHVRAVLMRQAFHVGSIIRLVAGSFGGEECYSLWKRLEIKDTDKWEKEWARSLHGELDRAAISSLRCAIKEASAALTARMAELKAVECETVSSSSSDYSDSSTDSSEDESSARRGGNASIKKKTPYRSRNEEEEDWTTGRDEESDDSTSEETDTSPPSRQRRRRR